MNNNKARGKKAAHCLEISTNPTIVIIEKMQIKKVIEIESSCYFMRNDAIVVIQVVKLPICKETVFLVCVSKASGQAKRFVVIYNWRE